MREETVSIPELAEKVKQRLEGGILYGIMVDFNDTDMVILAAYFLGRVDEANERRFEDEQKSE